MHLFDICHHCVLYANCYIYHEHILFVAPSLCYLFINLYGLVHRHFPNRHLYHLEISISDQGFGLRSDIDRGMILGTICNDLFTYTSHISNWDDQCGKIYYKWTANTIYWLQQFFFITGRWFSQVFSNNRNSTAVMYVKYCWKLN